MKLKMKMVAMAAAVLATGGANAAFVSGAVGNSTLGLLAFNTVTGSYYLRDLGFFMNSFLPSSGASITPSGDAATATFDKTPEAGLTLDKTNTASFSDASFASWLAGQTASDVAWTVMASDSQGTTTTNRLRQIGAISAGVTAPVVGNGLLNNGTVGINGFAASFGLSTTGTMSATQKTNALGNFLNIQGLLTGLDQVANLYYWAKSVNTGTTGTAFQQSYANSLNIAQLTLESDGDFSYVLAPASVQAVPLPAAAWLLGAGVLALGGLARRRSAAAEA